MTTSIAFAFTALLSFCLQGKEYHEFDYWSAFKTGSSVTLKINMEVGDTKIVVTLTRALVEVGADKVVVEQKSKVSTNGKEEPESSEKEEILKDKDKNPLKVEKEGDEEIEVAGKKLKCKWIEGTQSSTKVKFWVHNDIPGGVAKAEMSGGDLPGVIKVVVSAWEKK